MWIIKCSTSTRYFKKFTNQSFEMTDNILESAKFNTVKEAEDFLNKLNNHCDYNFKRKDFRLIKFG